MGYRRSSRAISAWHPASGKMNVLNGGEDAPMGPQDVRLLEVIFAAAVTLGLIVGVVALLN